MARARNIKPGFFKNYDLADMGPYAQILFAGLWCLADREGRLEDKPRFIKAEIFPYYDCDINGELTKLERLKLVSRYEVDGVSVILVQNFKKHQTPHNTEKASILPPPPAVTQCIKRTSDNNGYLTVDSPNNNDGKTPLTLIPDSLIPDSLNLIPDTGFPIPDTAPKKVAPASPKYSALDALIEIGVSEQIAKDWLAVRKLKKLAPTKTAIDGALDSMAKAKLSPEDGVRICCERGWGGFNPAWLANEQNARAGPQGYESAKDKSRREALDQLTGRRNNDNRTIDIN